MNDLIIFRHPDFGKIRTLERGGEPWLVGRDVAAALGYSDTYGALKKHVDEEDKQNCQNDSFGTPRGMTIINESGLYSLILSSKLPSAKKFKRWVTAEVLPSIRKHGGYLTPETAEAAQMNPDIIIHLAQALKEEQERRRKFEAMAKSAGCAERFIGIEAISDMPEHLFPQRLIHLRKERGLTQEGLAELIGKGRSTVSGYETESKEPTLKTICFLAHYFGVSTDYLLGYADERH